MRQKIKNYNIDPDEIFLDDSNLPSLNIHQFEGRIEKPISKTAIFITALVFLIIGGSFLARVGYLQTISGKGYAERSKNNSLRHTVIMPSRGIIYDRNLVELAWNKPERTYIAEPGFSHLLGYLGYPTEEETQATTTFAEKEQTGRAGSEKIFNDQLSGQKGVRIEEVNVRGDVVSDYSLKQSESGQAVNLSIDSRLQTKFFQIVKQTVINQDFFGGAGVVMDINTGEIISMVSYPEYDSNIMTSRSDKTAVQNFLTNSNKPFLNRAVSGLYAPGSVFKPIIALGALTEKTIDPHKQILSTGALIIPNPYNPKEKTIFKDWKAHGLVDMRWALAVSSDEYFYQIGGGYQDQKGLGIINIEKYARLFGLSQETGIELENEAVGTIPSPEWKAKVFNGEPWRLGDTYHTSIGQYGVLVTPLQMARVAAAIANYGTLVKPTILKFVSMETVGRATSTVPIGIKLPIAKSSFDVVHDGMQLSVTKGTAKGLDTPTVAIAAKTGTAELGVSKERVNSWVIGFWPFDNPKYAFAVVMESGSRHNTIGGVFVMRTLFDWMGGNLSEYLK
jgi:penicillin-binding protein 2